MIAIFLTIIHVIVCFVLILVILLQAGRGQGLSSAAFGSGNVQSLLGTRAADFMTKATTVSAILFITTCIGLDLLEAHKSKSLMQMSQKSAPVSMDQIREALEKMKAETAGTDTANVDVTDAEVMAGAEEAIKTTEETAFPETKPAEIAAEEVVEAIAPEQN